MVLSVEVLVVLIRLFLELFMKAHLKAWLLLDKSRFDRLTRVVVCEEEGSWAHEANATKGFCGYPIL